VPPARVGPFGALVAIPRGMADAAAVIFFVFLIGGAFTVVDETGALRQGVGWLVRRLGQAAHAERLVIPAASLAFALGGVLDNMNPRSASPSSPPPWGCGSGARCATPPARVARPSAMRRRRPARSTAGARRCWRSCS
jgi:hypothetical protein